MDHSFIAFAGLCDGQPCSPLSEDRLTAIDLVNGARQRAVIMRQKERTLMPEPQRQKEQEVAYGYLPPRPAFAVANHVTVA